MGLAKKGSRTIKVDEIIYRWVLSTDSGFMSIIAELDGGPGQRMEAQVSYRDQPGDSQQARVTPETVRRAINFAIGEGWTPNVVGLPPFRLIDADSKIWKDDV